MYRLGVLLALAAMVAGDEIDECLDIEPTGLELSGVPALCSQLLPLCELQSNQGQQVRTACPVSCGSCPTPGCKDSAVSWPVLSDAPAPDRGVLSTPPTGSPTGSFGWPHPHPTRMHYSPLEPLRPLPTLHLPLSPSPSGPALRSDASVQMPRAPQLVWTPIAPDGLQPAPKLFAGSRCSPSPRGFHPMLTPLLRPPGHLPRPAWPRADHWDGYGGETGHVLADRRGVLQRGMGGQ